MLHVGFPYTDRIPIYICIMLYISFDLYLGEVTYTVTVVTGLRQGSSTYTLNSEVVMFPLAHGQHPGRLGASQEKGWLWRAHPPSLRRTLAPPHQESPLWRENYSLYPRTKPGRRTRSLAGARPSCGFLAHSCQQSSTLQCTSITSLNCERASLGSV